MPGTSPVRSRLIDAARRIYHERKVRTKHFDTSLFGEPGWDILLVLYIEDGGRPMNVTSAALVTNSSETTSLRWVEALIGEGLIEVKLHQTDRRMRLITLSAAGCAIMDRYFADILQIEPDLARQSQ